MKKQILASVLASVLATSSVYAWGFGSSREKPNYDYSGEKELISLSSFSEKDLRIDDAKYWCLDQGNDLGCIWLDKLEALASKDIKKIANFYEKTVPEYCYDKKFAPARRIPAFDLTEDKIIYFSKKDLTSNHNIRKDFAKTITAKPGIGLKMLEYGCNELKSGYICRDLREIYKNLDDREKIKEYNDKIKNRDKKWDSVLYDSNHMRYIYKNASGWQNLEYLK